MRRFLGLFAIVAATSLGLSFATPARTASFAAPNSFVFPTRVVSSMLQTLVVTSETNTTTYDRDFFGDWIDADRDGCNTRKEVLQAESASPVTCSLKGGTWTSEYDRVKTSAAGSFDVDHMVPLKEAWVSGAAGWSDQTLREFANDLDYEHSLIAVSASSNRKKSDRDPASWMPSNLSFACQYLGRWVGVKYRWSLTVDALEHSVLVEGIEACGDSATVSVPPQATVVLADAQTLVARSNPALAQDRASSSGGALPIEVFVNCDALNAVYPGGVARSPETMNLVSGSPRATKYPLTVDAALYEANIRRDGDRDGVACER